VDVLPARIWILKTWLTFLKLGLKQLLNSSIPQFPYKILNPPQYSKPYTKPIQLLEEASKRRKLKDQFILCWDSKIG
jgi:hypothetical protein